MQINIETFNKFVFQNVILFCIPIFIAFRLFYYQGIINTPIVFLLVNMIKVFFILFFIFSIGNRKCFSVRVSFPFCTFLSIASLILMFNFDVVGATRNGYSSAIQYNTLFLVDYLFYFSIGCSLSLYPAAGGKMKWALFSILMFIFFINIDFSLLRLNINTFTSSAYHTSYIWFSDILAFFVFLYMKDIRNDNQQTMILLLLWCLSFFLISRTVFLLVTFILLIHFLLIAFPNFGFRKSALKLIIYTFVFLIACISLPIFDIDIFNSIGDNRITRFIINGVSNDQSLNERQAMFYSGLVDIYNSPILGKFGGQLQNDSSYWYEERWGAFIHNIFSYYRQFGLIPFLIINYLILYVLFLSFKIKSQNKIMFLGMLFFTIEQYFVRSFTSPYICAFIGYYSNGNLLRDFNEK